MNDASRPDHSHAGVAIRHWLAKASTEFTYTFCLVVSLAQRRWRIAQV